MAKKFNAHSSLVTAAITRLRMEGWEAWSAKTFGSLYDDLETGEKRWRPNVGGQKGSADIQCIVPPVGHALFVECKTGTGKQTPDQREFQRKVEAMGATYIVARSVADVDAYVRMIRAAHAAF